MKRADMIAGLKKAGHWEEVKSKPQSVKAKVKAIEKKATPKPAPKATPTKEAYNFGLTEGKFQANEDLKDTTSGLHYIFNTSEDDFGYNPKTQKNLVIEARKGFVSGYDMVMSKTTPEKAKEARARHERGKAKQKARAEAKAAKAKAEAKSPPKEKKISPVIKVDEDLKEDKKIMSKGGFEKTELYRELLKLETKQIKELIADRKNNNGENSYEIRYKYEKLEDAVKKKYKEKAPMSILSLFMKEKAFAKLVKEHDSIKLS
tara:strand:+ start:44 stop:826 length:783 start_codon:yes stop_codon:yes gene_type:complete